MLTITVYKNVQSVELSDRMGITMDFVTESKNGDTTHRVFTFDGEEFTPVNGTRSECLRVWRNLIRAYWNNKIAEAEAKEDNGGIASKLRGGTPSRVVIHGVDCTYEWVHADSMWERIGICPTKRDREELSNRGYKQKMHAAAYASFKVAWENNEFASELEGENENENAE